MSAARNLSLVILSEGRDLKDVAISEEKERSSLSCVPRIFKLTKWLRLINVEVAGKGKLLNEELMQGVFKHVKAGRSDVY